MRVLRKSRTLSMAVLAVAVSIGGVAAAGVAGVGATAAGATTTTTPACSFNKSTSGIVEKVKVGGTVNIACTGLPDDHPYLVLEISLLVALDPNTAGLLSGSISPSLLIGALSASPMINPSALELTSSNSSGDLTYAFKTPSNQPLDPNATCPPTQEEFNSGLIGCAIAMVDLTSGSELPQGQALLEYKGFPLFPQGPTLALSSTSVSPGETVNVSDKPGASTYWWLATLNALEADEGGTSTPATVAVTFPGTTVTATNNVVVTPASYNGTTFTPPALSGSFTVPTTGLSPGLNKVEVSYTASLEGLLLTNGKNKKFTLEPSS